MYTDAVEVPRTLADTEKTVKFIQFIPLKATIKFGSSVFCDCAITYRELYHCTLC